MSHYVSPYKKITIRLVICYLLALLTTGCAGISTHLRTDSTRLQGSVGFNHGTITGGKSTKDDVRSILGSPANITYADDNEVWWYWHDVAWRGVVPWIVVMPIPLIAPVGINHTVVTFQGNYVHDVIVEEASFDYYGCYMVIACGSYRDFLKQLH